MRHGLLLVSVLVAGTFLTVSCEKENQTENKKVMGGESTNLTLTPIEKLNQAQTPVNSHAGLTGVSVFKPIYGTYKSLGEDITMETKPVYPRFCKTREGDYLMFYHYGNASTWAGNECEYARSSDMVNWKFQSKLFAAYSITDCTGKSNKRGYAGAHPLLLANGDVLVVASTRAISSFRKRNADNGLAIRISHDNGHSWDAEKIVFVGTNWEPMPVQLSTGRIVIFYTDSHLVEGSSAFGEGAEVVSTGSSYIYSDDNGKTWFPSDALTYSKHLRAFAQVRCMDGSDPILTDQMPAAVELNGTKKLLAAAESFIGGPNHVSYISLAYSGDDYDWGKPDALGVLPEDRKSNICTGCAPYLVQFPSGETVLSYNDGSVFYLKFGDENGRNFSPSVKAFAQTAATGKGFWGAMYCADSHRLLASVGGSGNELQIGQFYLNHAITAASHPVTVDGNNSEWKDTDEAIYICSLGDAKATVRCSQDKENLYFLYEVSDAEISNDDYIQLFLSDPSQKQLGATSLRVNASFRGLKTSGPFAGSWKDQETGVKVGTAFDGTPSVGGDTDNGYLVEISVPKSALKFKDGRILANFGLFDIKNGGLDSVVSTAEKTNAAWIPILGIN